MDIELAYALEAFAADDQPDVKRSYRLVSSHDTDWIPSLDQGIVFDIETRPLPAEDLERIIPPFKGFKKKHPGEWDPESVKYGNTKDPAKRAEKEQAAKARHEKEVANWDREASSAEYDYLTEQVEKATLLATRSEVCTSQILFPNHDVAILHGSERFIIEATFEVFERCKRSGLPIYGFAIEGFDLPYLARRAAILGVPSPTWMIQNVRNWSDQFVDVMKAFGFGEYGFRVSLHELAASIGLPGKADQEVAGKDFHLYWDNAERRYKAIEYALTDVWLVEGILRHIGMIY